MNRIWVVKVNEEIINENSKRNWIKKTEYEHGDKDIGKAYLPEKNERKYIK